MKNNTTIYVHFAKLLAVSTLMFPAVVVKAQPPEVQKSPQQMVEEARTSFHNSIRFMMGMHGLKGAEIQDTLIEFLTQQAESRQNVKEQKQKLMDEMKDQLSSDAQILSQLNEYRASAEQAKEDYKKALVKLDAKIGYSKNPRLETVLVMLGIIGDEDWVASGPANFGVFVNKPKR